MKECPACRSTEFTTYEVHGRFVGVVGGPAIIYTAIEDHCLVCGETGDFEAANDDVIEKCLEISQRMRDAFGRDKS